MDGKYVNVTEPIREAQSNRLNGLRCPKALFLGLSIAVFAVVPTHCAGRVAMPVRPVPPTAPAPIRAGTREFISINVCSIAWRQVDGAGCGGNATFRPRRQTGSIGSAAPAARPSQTAHRLSSSIFFDDAHQSALRQRNIHLELSNCGGTELVAVL
jgi:hypothetical protein